MKAIGAALLIAGSCLIVALYLSLFGLPPNVLDDSFSGDSFRLIGQYIWLFSLFGLGVGSIIGGSVCWQFTGIKQTILDAVSSVEQSPKAHNESDDRQWNAIGGALMIAGVCATAILYLSRFGLLPKTLDDKLPGDHARLYGLFGLGIGSIISGAIVRNFNGILQSVLEAVKESEPDNEDKNEMRPPANRNL
jgi:hypothetical protein